MTDTTSLWIVEDDPTYRNALLLLLGSASTTRCDAAYPSCEAALEAARKAENHPDVVLLDINLPGMSGLEGLAGLKALLPQSRILMLTNRDDAATIYASLRSGASGYLLKSAGVDEILSAIAQAQRGGTLMPAPVARQVLTFFQSATLPESEADGYGLTEREIEVLNEMAGGYSQREIATRLFLSPHTVDSHIRHIYEKLHVSSGIEAVAKALRERLIQ